MVEIRRATQVDIPYLTVLLKVLFSIEGDFIFNEAKQRMGLQKIIGNERGCVLVAEHSGHIIGMCTGQLTVSTAEGGIALLIEDVVVAEDWRSQGIGRQLMDEMSTWARLRGVSRLQLLADKTNTDALGFYRRIGWTTTQLICLRKRIN